MACPPFGKSRARALRYHIQGVGSSKTSRALKCIIDVSEHLLVARDLQSAEFVAAAVKATREKFALLHTEEIAEARAAIVARELRAGKFLDMASQLETVAPVLRRVEELERERTAIERRMVAWEKEDETAQVLANITDAQVRKMLSRQADDMRLYDRADLRDFLGSILDRVELDPEAATLQVCYRIPLRGG